MKKHKSMYARVELIINEYYNARVELIINGYRNARYVFPFLVNYFKLVCLYIDSKINRNEFYLHRIMHAYIYLVKI